MGPTLVILEMARAYGLRPRLWLLPVLITATSTAVKCHRLFFRLFFILS